ncbi:GAF domain-containing protein [Aquipuribacter hungaricus]|uniref:GAF domain-containing protein n=1 Tax=Aquipuribacter hungaricus TaxID=545624 RepID=A0ABV7WG28_9MICO
MHDAQTSGSDAAATRRRHGRWQEDGNGAGPEAGRDAGPDDAVLVRPLVEESWRRSRAAGVDPEHPVLDVDVDDATLSRLRRASPLTTALPLLERMLLDGADDAHVLAVSDAEGRLLHVRGDTQVRRRMESLGFTEGARWDEAHVGTNAPGTALALDTPVRILSGEHWATPVHRWSCSAAPVHDPVTGEVLGAVDLSGGDEVASSYALALVRAAAAAVEASLLPRAPAPRRRGEPVGAAGRGADPGGQVPGGRRAGQPVGGPGGAPAWLQVLGVDQPVLHVDGRAHPLTPRHAEILLVLAGHEAGVGGDALAESLSEQLLSPVTVRAEVSRLRSVLRRLLGAEAVGTRPYRLLVPLRSDADDVAAALARGAHRRALDLYGGPLLPASEAPVATRARHELQGRLRGSVLRAGSTDSLWRWASTQGRDDLEAWQRLLRELPYGSPRRAEVSAHLAALAAAG